ncbi:MAG TPA: DUF2946 family protein [Afifellaceae bacterium]|nr:DUF2946 family protein [Afifellaceae bacterium]
MLAILTYQPLAALHFASDEAHLAHATTSIQVAAHDGGHHQPGRHSHGQGHDHADQLCDFCILVGVSLPPLPVAAGHSLAEHRLSARPPAEYVRAEKRLRIGHPVRAPPLTV